MGGQVWSDGEFTRGVPWSDAKTEQNQPAAHWPTAQHWEEQHRAHRCSEEQRPAQRGEGVLMHLISTHTWHDD